MLYKSYEFVLLTGKTVKDEYKQQNRAMNEKKPETEPLPSRISHSTCVLFNATLKCTLSYYIMLIKGFLLHYSSIRTYKVLSSLKVTKVKAKVAIIFYAGI